MSARSGGRAVWLVTLASTRRRHGRASRRAVGELVRVGVGLRVALWELRRRAVRRPGARADVAAAGRRAARRRVDVPARGGRGHGRRFDLPPRGGDGGDALRERAGRRGADEAAGRVHLRARRRPRPARLGRRRAPRRDAQRPPERARAAERVRDAGRVPPRPLLGPATATPPGLEARRRRRDRRLAGAGGPVRGEEAGGDPLRRLRRLGSGDAPTRRGPRDRRALGAPQG